MSPCSCSNLNIRKNQSEIDTDVTLKEFLQMGYLTVTHKKEFTIHAEKGLWLYALLTFPLICTTIGVLVVSELVAKRKRKAGSVGVLQST